MPDADRLFDLTPREIAWRLEAHKTRRRELDESAWMTAQYVAFAVHAPEKLPGRPMFTRAEKPDMSDDDIKSRLLAWAGKDNA